MNFKKGFTLIELLVVISIIGLLSTIAITSLNSARNKAKTSNVQSDMNNFINAVVVAQGEQGENLMDITGSGCSRCSSCSSKDLRNISQTDPCYVAWVNALTKIELAAGDFISGLDAYYRDPWGSPYLLDENEGERPLDPCIKDNINSAGPDGYFGTSDDITFHIPFANCT